MALYIIVLISSLFIVNVYTSTIGTELVPSFEPCNKDDLKCLQTATKNAVAAFYGGTPAWDIKPIDPLEIPSLEGDIDNDTGIVFHFKNTTITGLKGLTLRNFTIDTDKKTVSLQLTADLKVTSEVDVEYTKQSVSIPGNYKGDANVISLSEYGYSIKEVDGVKYFEVAPETNTCQNEVDPYVSLKVDVTDVSDKEQFTKLPELNKADLRKKTMCQFTVAAAAAVIQGLRGIARVYQASSFLKDV